MQIKGACLLMVCLLSYFIYPSQDLIENVDGETGHHQFNINKALSFDNLEYMT
jgi:hypothetical protein